jgi:hypothetical protein
LDDAQQKLYTLIWLSRDIFWHSRIWIDEWRIWHCPQKEWKLEKIKELFLKFGLLIDFSILCFFISSTIPISSFFFPFVSRVRGY